MILLKFQKTYNKDRYKEPCCVAIPIEQGQVRDCSGIKVCKDTLEVLSQVKITSRWEDGSVRWIFVRFLADLPANASTEYQLYLDSSEVESKKVSGNEQISVLELNEEGVIVLDTGKVRFTTAVNQEYLFENIIYGKLTYKKEQITGPVLKDGKGNQYRFKLKSFQVVEQGPVCAVLRGVGYHEAKDIKLRVEITLTAYAGKPDIEVAYRLFNTTCDPLHIASLTFGINALSSVERTCAATSNYKTQYEISNTGMLVEKIIDAEYLLYEANEHNAEVFYGTMFTDFNTAQGGISATIYQAQQNYPKAVSADENGICIKIVPEGVNEVIMQSGMAREQKFLLHFHDYAEDIKEINNRSLIYQMPDRPHIDPQVYKNAGVMHDVFVEDGIPDVELALIQKADSHSRCYGMLNWGDSPDSGYTMQGRGGGSPVWTNNEYDYPHACALMYARTGTRRFLDYLLVSGRHWMDVDVCHFSDDPLLLGGQWEHTKGHVIGGKIVCSHQWVEGLLDYYHFTGDEVAFQTAIGIGHNILRLLDTPMFHQKGEINARETGWALRSLVAIYKETHSKDWLLKCDWIVGHFEDWEKEYGHWLSPYTDNTTIRVPFMISIAVGSLMRYYRIRPQEKIKEMILRAVDDMIEHCYLEQGLFYYKELPSLQRLGNNTMVLEALTIAYELTGQASYLTYGTRTFMQQTKDSSSGSGGGKRIVGDALIGPGSGTKGFGQSFIPLVSYYKAAMEAGLLKNM